MANKNMTVPIHRMSVRGLRYLNYVLKDGIRFMPGFLTCTIIVHIINAVLAVRVSLF